MIERTYNFAHSRKDPRARTRTYSDFIHSVHFPRFNILVRAINYYMARDAKL